MGAVGKRECLSRSILFGDSAIRKAVTNFAEHYHGEEIIKAKKTFYCFRRLSKEWVLAMAKYAARSDWAAC